MLFYIKRREEPPNMVSIQKNGIFREEGMGMERYFNTEGVCDPQLHYMVRLDDRAEEIKRLFVDRGKYFVISRGRQYGKTTTLRALVKYLQRDYIVLSTDFQEIGTAEFKDEDSFARAFAEVLVKAFHGGGEQRYRPKNLQWNRKGWKRRKS